VQVDWFTIVAEIVNFIILLVLLQRFLYSRIVGITEERESRINSRFQEAEQKARKGEQEAENYRRQQQQLEEKREEFIRNAREEANQRRKEWLEEARQEVEGRRREWHETIEQEKYLFLQDLRERAGRQVYAIARRALADLANADLEKRIIDAFVEQIEGLDDDEREEITEAIRESDQEVVIYSAFKIPEEKRQELIQVMREEWGDGLKGQFRTSSDLICGIEIRTDGHQIGWSVGDYLSGLEENLSRFIEAEMSEVRTGTKEEKKQTSEAQGEQKREAEPH
jgi:F-type H+-transporting ATPase subunit b